MSDDAAEDWTPNVLETEMDRAKREDPRFPEVLARCLAKARGEAYDPKRHGPFDVKKPPRQQRRESSQPESVGGELEAILERFRAKGPKYTPKFTGPSRPDTHRRIAP